LTKERLQIHDAKGSTLKNLFGQRFQFVGSKRGFYAMGIAVDRILPTLQKRAPEERGYGILKSWL